jgi:hypothetical protein
MRMPGTSCSIARSHTRGGWGRRGRSHRSDRERTSRPRDAGPHPSAPGRRRGS